MIIHNLSFVHLTAVPLDGILEEKVIEGGEMNCPFLSSIVSTYNTFRICLMLSATIYAFSLVNIVSNYLTYISNHIMLSVLIKHFLFIFLSYKKIKQSWEISEKDKLIQRMWKVNKGEERVEEEE